MRGHSSSLRFGIKVAGGPSQSDRGRGSAATSFAVVDALGTCSGRPSGFLMRQGVMAPVLDGTELDAMPSAEVGATGIDIHEGRGGTNQAIQDEVVLRRYANAVRTAETTGKPLDI
jgi:hypothetical protein